MENNEIFEEEKTEIEIVFEQIAQLKARLNKTDYQAIKLVEGEITESEYAPIKEQRKAWRAEINELEAKVKELKELHG